MFQLSGFKPKSLKHRTAFLGAFDGFPAAKWEGQALLKARGSFKGFRKNGGSIRDTIRAL